MAAARPIGAVEAGLIGLAGNAPTYSIAVTTAALVAVAGKGAAFALLASGVLMGGILLAYGRLNELHPSAGAAYTWGTDHLGGIVGFFAGWAVLVSSTLFLVSGLLPAGKATLLIVAPSLAADKTATTLVAIAWLLLVSGIVYRGISLVGRIQGFLTGVELVLVALIAAGLFCNYGFAALSGVSAGAMDAGVLAQTLVISVFFYWGWDVVFNLAEETRDTRRVSSRAANAAYVALVVLFTVYAAFTTSVLTDAEIRESGDNIVFALVNKALPAPFGLIAIVTFLLSTIGAVEASLLSFSRTMFARQRDVSSSADIRRAVVMITAFGAALLAASYAASTVEEAVAATITASGVLVSYYYGVAGIACAKALWKQPAVSRLYVALPLASVGLLAVAGVVTLSRLGAMAVATLGVSVAVGACVYWRRI